MGRWLAIDFNVWITTQVEVHVSSLISYGTINVETELSTWTIEDAFAFVGCDEAIAA